VIKFEESINMEKIFINFFKSFKKTIRNNYNLVDFAKKSKKNTLPRSRASINKEYQILNKYKQKLISKEEAFKQLITLKELTGIDAKNILKNIDNNNVTPMKLND